MSPYLSSPFHLLFLLVLLFPITACDKVQELTQSPQEYSKSALTQHLQNSFYLATSGWSLSKVYIADKQLYATVNFPNKIERTASTAAPVYSEIVRLCPINGVDTYWDSKSALPFTLYLSKTRKARAAIAMARCTRLFDQSAFDRVISVDSAKPEPPKELIHDGTDLKQLEASLSQGNPSFNDAKDAIYSDDYERLQQYLNARPELVHLYDTGGSTLLFSADSATEVYILIAYGAETNIRRKNGPTILGWASELGRSSGAVKQLIESGADTSVVDVSYAADDKIAKLLIKAGAKISKNALFNAIESGKFDVAQLLYDHGARLDTTTVLIDSPLHHLIANAKYSADKEKVIKQIEAAIKYGADTQVKYRNQTPLDKLQQQEDWSGKERVVAMLREAGS